jgi:hypothetical protein
LPITSRKMALPTVLPDMNNLRKRVMDSARQYSRGFGQPECRLVPI